MNVISVHAYMFPEPEQGANTTRNSPLLSRYPSANASYSFIHSFFHSFELYVIQGLKLIHNYLLIRALLPEYFFFSLVYISCEPNINTCCRLQNGLFSF